MVSVPNKPDTVSESFPYTDAGFDDYKVWVNAYRQKMRDKYGEKAESVSTSMMEFEVDGVRQVQVLLEVNFKEDDNGIVPPSAESSGGT